MYGRTLFIYLLILTHHFFILIALENCKTPVATHGHMLVLTVKHNILLNQKDPCIHVHNIHSARHRSKHPWPYEQTRAQAFSSSHGPESTIQAHLLPRLADEKIPGFDLAWQAPAERQQGNLSQPFLPSKRDECQRVTGAVSCQFAIGQTLDQ